MNFAEKEAPDVENVVETTAKAAAEKRRVGLMDDLRGFCVFCMIFYHAFVLMAEGFGWTAGARLFAFFAPAEPWFAGVFILLCGISCRLSHNNWARGGKLLLIALLITAVTAYVLPLIGLSGMAIWFGILHLLSLCILLFALLEKPLTKVPPAAGIAVFAVLFLLFRNWVDRSGNLGGSVGLFGPLVWNMPASWHEAKWLFPLGIMHVRFWSADYFPLIPYGFLFFVGTYPGIYVRDGRLPEWAYPTRSRPLSWLGTHALLIYVLHMPVIFVLLLLVQGLMKLFS